MISMRLKLTAWYLGILAAVLLAFGVGLYLYLSTALLKVVDSSLNQRRCCPLGEAARADQPENT